MTAASNAVIGTGTWGTACAMVIARNHPQEMVVLWGRDADKCAAIQASRQHPLLNDITLPDNILVTADTTALAAARLCFWAVPTQFSAGIAKQLQGALAADAALISLSKGLETKSRARISEILDRDLSGHPFAVLSGPSHAEEVAHGLPAGLVCAAAPDLAQAIVDACHQASFRLYTTEDVVGVELGGALKNVVAIAAGIVDGMQLGDNIKATLVTRGLAEIRRLGRQLGAEDSTFAGLAGIGDLLTTCYSPFGRNRRLGERIGKGESPESVLADTTMVAEGAWTCQAAVALAEAHDVELPVAEQVTAVLWDKKPLSEAIEDLLSRASKDENL